MKQGGTDQEIRTRLMEYIRKNSPEHRDAAMDNYCTTTLVMLKTQIELEKKNGERGVEP